jgi:hypothetical protein
VPAGVAGTTGPWGRLRVRIFSAAQLEISGEANLVRLIRRLSVPASESQMAIALALSIVTMSLMLCAILWQSNVIQFQRDLIRVIWTGH